MLLPRLPRTRCWGGRAETARGRRVGSELSVPAVRIGRNRGAAFAAGRRLALALRKRLVERLPEDPESGYDLGRGADVVARVSGNVAHLYFNVSRERMDVSEIALLYPELLDALNDHPGFGLLLALEEERPVVVTPRGTMGLTPEASRRPPRAGASRGGSRPLAQLPPLRRPGRDRRLESRGRVVTFEDQVATHGGVGGPQDYPFFLTPPTSTLDLTHVTHSTQIYPYFIQTYHSQAAHPLEATPAATPVDSSAPTPAV